jgi:glycogen debranching enzyme
VVRRYPSGAERGIDLQWPGAVTEGAELRLDVVVPPRGTAHSRIEVFPLIDGHRVLIQHQRDGSAGEHVRVWRESTATFWIADPEWNRTLQRSKVDLGALRIRDPECPEVTVLAAGLPWFMALFGRDSLLASYMALALDPDLALGTLQTLARLQGTHVEENSEEEPGRILHEVRFGADPSLALGGRNVYYGSADATPLFVVLLGELLRWGAPPAQIQPLLPHADRALAWLAGHDQGGDHPFVAYHRATSRGLRNQGWKDSWDGVTFADGRLAEPPVALCEVQGYAYAAYLARAEIAAVLGQEETRRHCTDRAQRLRTAFNEQFWLPRHHAFALALDADGRPVDSLASNMGHCLWSGIVDEDKAPGVVAHLMSADMFSGWGIRTLAASMAAYNPMSYHNGSVWPHDNALIVDGLMRYGFVAEARRVAAAQLDAAAAFGGRLPELFCGFPRQEYPHPVPFPTSCAPQAWASAAPIQLLRSLLRLDPRLPDGGVHLAPTLPAGNHVTITNLRLGDDHITVRVDDAGARLDGPGVAFGGRP